MDAPSRARFAPTDIVGPGGLFDAGPDGLFELDSGGFITGLRSSPPELSELNKAHSWPCLRSFPCPPPPPPPPPSDIREEREREWTEGRGVGCGRLKRWRCLGEEMIPAGTMDTKNVIIRHAVIAVRTKTDSNARCKDLPKAAGPAPGRTGFPFEPCRSRHYYESTTGSSGLCVKPMHWSRSRSLPSAIASKFQVQLVR